MPNPFGLELGSTPNADVAIYFVSFRTVPRPHPDLEKYYGYWRPDVGLFSVFANSAIHAGDSSALSARRLYEKIKRQISEVYGSSQEIEQLDDGAYLTSDSDFFDSIIHNQRSHVARWSEASGAQLDASIKEIWLSIEAESSYDCSVRVEYKMIPADAMEHDNLGLDSL